VARLHGAITAVLRDEGVRHRLIEAGAVPAPSPSAAHVQDFIASELTRWRTVIQDVGATPD
jgi:tripartite-type tricarboxylate transporter receptor subunit TctC